MAKEMSEAAREAQREYHRKYRKTHKDQLRETRRRYWERKAAERNTGSEADNEPKEEN